MAKLRSSMANGLSALLCLACLIGGGLALTALPRAHIPNAAIWPVPGNPESLAADGIENLWRLPLARKAVLFSGGQPEGDAGFAALKQLGVRTVISVDGARPDVESAARFGLRYVHLPIGYDDVPADRVKTMVAAAASLPGPAFVHCHHGRHRGPAAAVCLWRALRDDVSAEAGAETLRRMGTAEKYRGLYRAAGRDPSAEWETQSASMEFPEMTAVAPLAEQMVEIDHVWEKLRESFKADPQSDEERRTIEEFWTDGAERFREAARLTHRENETTDADLRATLLEAAELWSSAASLPQADWLPRQKELSQRVEQQCHHCHARHRDGE